MCQSIPGKVEKVSGNLATIDYFGEKRIARTDGIKLKPGDYVYVQGGFVVDKAGVKEAKEALSAWKAALKQEGNGEKASASPLRLFFLYAHPCGEVLVAKGRIKPAQLASVRKSLLNGGVPRESPLLFEKAVERLGITASRLSLPLMDESSIRRHFWFDHDDVVEDRANCRILPAKALKIDGSNALVSTPLGLRNVNISMVDKVKPGDLLAIHYQYACEKIGKDDFDRLWKVKK